MSLILLLIHKYKMSNNCHYKLNSLNHVLEVGMPYPVFESYLNSYSQYIDFIKFGWGSALIDPEFTLKKKLCDQLNVRPLLGGTFFEYMIYHHDFDEFAKYIFSFGLDCVELSRGTVEIEDNLYSSFIHSLSSDYFVMSEVGRKSSDPAKKLTPADWLSHCELSAEAGASLIILESRESGLSGYVSTVGDVDEVVLDTITSVIPVESLLFEAPIKSVQTFLLKRFGALVNLGNLSLSDLVAVQSLRCGLRSDTLLDMHPKF